MDIEGAELHALRGAAAMLAREPRPIWIVEITIDEHLPGNAKVNPNLEATFDLFRNAGYGAWTATATPRTVDSEEIRAIACGGPNTLGTHNFLFAQPGQSWKF